MAKQHFNSDIWNKGKKFQRGNTYLDLKKGSCSNYLKITQEKKLADGTVQKQSVILQDSELPAFRKLIEEATNQAVQASMPLNSTQPASTSQSQPTQNLLQRKLAQGKNAYEKWTKEEDALIDQLHAQGLSDKDIAARIGRGEGAVNSRLKKRGKI